MSLSGILRPCVIAAVTLLAGVANAQPPQEITATDTIEFGVGQTRTFMFDQPVSEFRVVADGVVKVTPLSDRTFSIEAQQPGEVLAIVYAPDRQVIQRMNLAVAGHMVKVYGLLRPSASSPLGKGMEYTAYMCTKTGCGRANPDLVPAPTAAIISETKQKGDGDSVTTTKEYR
ncbi:pilus assembly protein N-terminal domain-containing protein [Bradyrhizobium sp. 144]|uniref:pilus assembly protein N-terminal domain-containing protein n=1 Tax=Bradyrhizobium sp. 144 TaxID=2782620 RepID=UPI001FF93077|nr:pilus assembly protein N-terminal domain-containing protein [Bradyrhizobium sp. 144]MCK1693097.1 pilus assembly protein N-terminal domain-containing protein [Bradyrhizobium sp. 144]